MKKLATTLLMMSIILSINAQDSTILTSKNGVPVLPEKGDFAFGINAASLFSIFKDGVSAPSFDFINGNVFTFKYFLADKSALRSFFRIGNLSTKVDDQDWLKETNIVLGMGWEKRVGSSRVQGFFGFDGGGIYYKHTEKDASGDTYVDDQGFGATLSALIGAEYFIAPKLSLGGQFNWGLNYLSVTDNTDDSKLNTMEIDLDIAGGAIMLTFHF